MITLNLLDCNCHGGHNENVCEKSTGKCGDCKMGFHGASCDKGNKKTIFKSHLLDLSGLKNQSVNCRWIGFTALTRSKRRH